MSSTSALSLRTRCLAPYVAFFTRTHLGYILKYDLEITESRDNFFLMESNKMFCTGLENVEFSMMDEHIEFMRQHDEIIKKFELLEKQTTQSFKIMENNRYLKMKKFFYWKLVNAKKIIYFAQNYLSFFRNFISAIGLLHACKTIDYLYLKSMILFKEIWRKFFMKSVLNYTIWYKMLIVLENTFYDYTIVEQQYLSACFEQESPLKCLLNMCNLDTFISDREFYLDNMFIRGATETSSGDLIKFQQDFIDFIATEDDFLAPKILQIQSTKKRTFPVQLE